MNTQPSYLPKGESQPLPYVEPETPEETAARSVLREPDLEENQRKLDAKLDWKRQTKENRSEE